MKKYMILDSRANYDEDEAEVMDVFEAENHSEAIAHQKESYEDESTVLFEVNEPRTTLVHADI